MYGLDFFQTLSDASFRQWKYSVPYYKGRLLWVENQMCILSVIYPLHGELDWESTMIHLSFVGF